MPRQLIRQPPEVEEYQNVIKFHILMIDTSLDELEMLEKNHNAKRQEINSPPAGKMIVAFIVSGCALPGPVS
jgi:hypothetical protein